MTTLADKAILSGADNRPPMLEKDMYDSWKSIMELYMMNRQHGRMILESVQNKAIQADCDIKATNIILQGLPPLVYALSQQYSTNPSSTPSSITYPSNDYQSSVHHNVYSPPQSIPQLKYPPTVNLQPQQADLMQLDSSLTVLVFKQGDDPIDAINHMMSFLSAVVTSRYSTTNYQLRNSSNPSQQATINDERDKVLLVQAQSNGQIRHEEELAFLADPGIIEVALMANLSHYGSDVLTEFFYDHTAKKALGFQNPFYPKKAQQLEPKIYDGNVIKNTFAIIIPDSKETLMLAEESRSKMILKQQDPMVLEKKVNTKPVDYVALNQLSQDFKKQFVPQTKLSAEQAFWSQNSLNSSGPSPSSTPTRVEVSKELPKEKDLVITTLKNESRKLKGKDLADNIVTRHAIAPEMLKVDVEPLAPKLLNNRTTHSDCLRHTQEQAAILKKVVEQGKSQNPLNNSLDHACMYTKIIHELRTTIVQHSKLKLICVKCNGCMIFDNNDLCVLNSINDVNAHAKTKSVKKISKRKVWKPTGKVFTIIRFTWRPTGRTFTIVENACHLTRITTTTEVLLRKPTAIETNTPKPVVTLVYSKKPRKSKTNVSVSKPKIIKSISAKNKEPNKS
nr:hypothetical protein [Tanacetum cinerariifolium]